jgi:hypothetical protein
MDIDTRIANLVAATVTGTPIEQELLRAPVIALASPITKSTGTSAPPLVILETRRSCFFKRFRDQVPRICANYRHHPYDVPLNEVATWRLAWAMGNPWRQLLPTSVFRKIEEAGGALINAKHGIIDYDVFAQAPAQVAAAAFFDALVGNQDRNAGNFRYDAATKRLGLIDHGFVFARPGDPINNGSFFAAHRRHQNQLGLTQRELEALEHLLGTDDLHGLRGFIAHDRAEALEARAEKMLGSKCLLGVGAF